MPAVQGKRVTEVMKPLVEIFHDYVGFIERQIAIREGWKRVVGIKFRQVFRLFSRNNINDINGDALFRQTNLTRWEY